MKQVFLLFLFLISVSFYQLVPIDSSKNDLIAISSLLIIIIYIKKIKLSIDFQNNKIILILLFYSIISSIFMAYINFGQPYIYSLRVLRYFITLLFLLLALEILLKDINLFKLKRFFYILSIFIFTLYFYIFLTNDFSFLSENARILERVGEVRINIAYSSILFLLLFFLIDLKNHKISYLPFTLLLLSILIIDKTRSVILAIGIILVFNIFSNLKNKNIITLVLFIIILLIFSVLSQYETILFGPILKLINLSTTEMSSNSGNINIRFLELNYFWNHLDFTSMMFGYGMENDLFKILYYEKFYLSDIGIFKVFYLHGIVGLILYILFYLKLYREAKKGDSVWHKLGIVFILFQILTPSIDSFHKLTEMFFIFALYIIIKNLNKERNVN